MGGGSALTSSSSKSNTGTATFGFGQGSSLSAAFGPAKAAWPQSCVEPKKQKTGLAEKSLNGNASQLIAEDGGAAGAQITTKAGPAGLPAFLQPAKVAETYGSSTAPKQDQQ